MNQKKKWAELLRNWNLSYDAFSIEATFYDHWEKSFEKLVWMDEFGSDNHQYIWPHFNTLDELVRLYPDSKWFDNVHTSKVENLADLCIQSFRETATETGEINEDNIEKFQWQYNRQTDLNHLAKIPGMGRLNLPTAGAPDIVNATGKTFGPSWRFAIEMGKLKKAYGIYPGGQSGYPGSRYYDNMVDDWVEGNYYQLDFPKSPDQIQGKVINWEPLQ